MTPFQPEPPEPQDTPEVPEPQDTPGPSGRAAPGRPPVPPPGPSARPSGLPPPPRTRPDMPIRPRPPARHDASMPPDRLRVLLGTAIMRQVSLGWRIESQFANYAVMATGGEVNHAVHLLATMLTCGLWVPIWVIMGITGSEKRVTITVDPNGVVLFDGLPAQGPPPIGRTPRGPVVRPWRGNTNADAIAAVTMRRKLRQAAREQAEQDPALARDLRIGRPDLPREYDDGGLIDINHVPPPALTVLSGVTTEIAERIVANREHAGLFTSAEDLVITVDLHHDLLPEIKEYGIFLP